MRTTSVVHAVETHACGEPARVIVGGVADVPGQTMFEKMIYLKTHADNLRLRMLREPRGYPAANCNLILPATRPEADAGYVIMEQVEYPGMSGTNTIAVTTVLIETGMVQVEEQLDCVHPDNPEIRGVTIAQLSAPPIGPDADRRNNVIVSTGALDWDRPSTWKGVLDRSPCGTGPCAKMAALHAKGQLALNKDFRHEGVLGTVFTGRLLRETTVGNYGAVVPTLTGTAWIMGR